MSRQGEGIFKTRVQKDLKDDWGDCVDILATQERGRKGVPDLIICLKGHSVKMELKIDGENPTKLQQHMLDRHSRAGGISMHVVPSSWETQRELLRERFGFSQ